MDGTWVIGVGLDLDDDIFENNDAGTAESNNTAEISLFSGLGTFPDLQVQNLAVDQSLIQSGDTVTIRWNDFNSGNGAVVGEYYDSVSVRNTTTNEYLLDSGFNIGEARIEAGQSLARSYSFILPKGLRGVGTLDIRVGADRNNSILENNNIGTAESNNTAQISLVSSLGTYPDLQVHNLAVDQSLIKSGDRITISWNDFNGGNAAVKDSYYDRVYLRNTTTNKTFSDNLYAGAAQIEAGQSRARSYSYRLPNGLDGVGTWDIQVGADQYNYIFENNNTGTAESNNTALISVVSSFGAHPDLQVQNLAVDQSLIQSGDSITIRWNDFNSGNATINREYYNRVYLRNTTTNETSLNTVAYFGAAPIEAGQSLARSYSFTLPNGLRGVGTWDIEVNADQYNDIFEYNNVGTAESNNTAQLSVVSTLRTYPDLQVQNLAVDQSSVNAGDSITIRWDDFNSGNGLVAGAFYDLIVIKNKTSGEQLSKTTVYYDPALSGNGAISPGQLLARSFVYRLPDGTRGAGEIEVTVTTDQNLNAQGSVFEANQSNTAVTNNSSIVQLQSVIKPYADLRTSALNVPANAASGSNIEVSWTVENLGLVSTGTGWTDRIVLSKDGVIGNADDVVLANVQRSGALGAGGSYTQTASLRIPMRIDGPYRIAVIADVTSLVLEPDTRTNNTGISSAISILSTNADLVPEITLVPVIANAGRSARIEWKVTNRGTVASDVSAWVDRVYLSTTPTLNSNSVSVISLTHTGALEIGASYNAAVDAILPSTVTGALYLIVKTDVTGQVYELGSAINNNVIAAAHTTQIFPEPKANLQITDLQVPTTWKVGDTVSLSYSVQNNGNEIVSTALTDSIRLVDVNNSSNVMSLKTVQQNRLLGVGASYSQTLSFEAPAVATGAWRLEVITDSLNSSNELNETDNTRTQLVNVIHPDLRVDALNVQGLRQGGEALNVSWVTSNIGSADAAGVKDAVYLSRDGELGLNDIKLGEYTHAAIPIAGSAFVSFAVTLPVDAVGTYQLLVVTDAGNLIKETQAGEINNQASALLNVAQDYYADLAISDVSAPTRVIDDPAPLEVRWTVTNQGTGAGRTNSWVDRVLLSSDDILGNADDRIVGEYRHDGALAQGETYSRSERMLLPAASVGRYQLFVVTDARAEVFEKGSEANNIGRINHAVDVMTIPYADLQVESVSTSGTPASGRPLRVTWSVVNTGIGLTNVAEWSDSVWLSRNADGSGVVKSFGSASHIGQLAVNDRYSRSLDVTLPEGIEGTFYINVRTGGPFEFVFNNNNQASSGAIPVLLSQSPDLKVESITLPTTALEGAVIDVSWSVVNQGPASAGGVWTDTVQLVSVGGGAAVTLGSFSYDRGLDSGIRYSRTEQLRLPAKIEGLYRIKVITNSAGQLYEYGAAAGNNAFDSTELTEVSLNDRPDLRVGTMTVPEHVTAGTSASIRYSVINQGPAAASGRWKDKVFLSLDATLSGDDLLVGQFDNTSALAPTEAYASTSAAVDIPIRYRGNAFLIVVADGNNNNNIDEYPSEGNNIKAAQFYVDPIPFGDLVTSDIVAPEQAVHGASIEVRYKVSNLGSDTTRGNSAAVSSWTDTVWLARDKRRPGAYKGDVIIGSITHNGNLAVGADYLGTAQVTIPDNSYSGNYFITVWSDAYDVILEDTLASNINLDDANQLDNNNYKARAINVIGITPPAFDLTVIDVTAPVAADAGGNYTFSYSVQNKGDAFSGYWEDLVYLTENADPNSEQNVYFLGSYNQQRAIGSEERYTVTQTVQLAPSVKGRQIVVKTDVPNRIGETNESNNLRAAGSVIASHPADLQVTSLETQLDNFSGEDSTITWTVTNQGEAVWPGTRDWADVVYFSKDPSFIPSRASLLGSFVHSNVAGLAANASYTTSAKIKLPPGTEGTYYLYVITDAVRSPVNPSQFRSETEYLAGGYNPNLRDYNYASSVFEGGRNDNNMAGAALNITYREPDLQIDSISVSDPAPYSGQQISVSWTVTNRGSRDTRSSNWFDGVYLSRDDSLDGSDTPLVDRGNNAETYYRIASTVLLDANQPKYLKPGQSYTNTATFNLPESISGNFKLIVKADTAVTKDFYPREPSTIRDGLSTIAEGFILDAVKEFKDEGNNVAFIALPITLGTPPDLQVAQVTAPASVLAGQSVSISYRVVNAGGNTTSDQGNWNDLVYLSKDRFLDVNQDRYVGYVGHGGGLAAGATYERSLSITAPRDLEGAYYVFVITDPARTWGTGAFGSVREFGKEQNNASAAEQPIIVNTPPPADLKVTSVAVPSSGIVGEAVQINYSIINDSINPAYGRWTDALYLSSDNAWDLGDILLGKLDHVGDLGAQASYNGSLTAKLPPLKDGSWRIIVRPDLYNEVFEGRISYTATGLNLPPGEANNRQASGGVLQVQVPTLTVASLLNTTLAAGQTRLYKVSVASGETLRVTLDSSAEEGANEVYIRYGDIPTGFAFDAAYSNPSAADQEALIPSTQAGDYYILLRARQTNQSNDIPVTLRADLLPLAITKITPDQGGTGDDNHRWVTFDIDGASFKAGALVKLSRPGVFEIEPARWQVLDATHIRAVFDLRFAPRGLYDLMVINPDGKRVTEINRYLVERGIKADVTIGIGGPRSLNPGDSALYSVSLQSLTNVDTPYVRFDIGATEMGNSADVLDSLNLPYVLFGSNVGGAPDGKTADAAGNTQTFGATPTAGLSRADIPWASLDGTLNATGTNLAPGYAFDVAAGGFVGMSFNLQTYPGLKEWLSYDFEGLRDKLYATHPDWKASGLLDAGVSSLENIQPGLTAKFLHIDSGDDRVHYTKLEELAAPFRFNLTGAATPLTRDEFVADQTAHAKQLRSAILADNSAPSSLAVLAADEQQWVKGWLGALEAAGLLRPLTEAPPIRNQPEVLSLNATLATGILLAKGGDSYRTQSDLLGFFAKVQQWYGDTAKFSSDPQAAKAAIQYQEYRKDGDGNEAYIPVPFMADPAAFDQQAAQDTHFINFNVFAGGLTELEYLRHIGVLDAEFNPVAGKTLNLTQYLQQAAQKSADAQALISVTGPLGTATAADGSNYVPANTPLPYTLSINNPTNHAVSQVRIVTELDADLDARSLRLGDLKLGDINIHVPADKAVFQGDFDFTGSKGYILRVSAGIDVASRTATWLLQAIDPDTGETMRDNSRGLLAPAADPSKPNADSLKRGFVSYSVRAVDGALSNANISTQARVFLGDAPPADSAVSACTLDAHAPVTTTTVSALGNNAQGAPAYDVKWSATDDASGVKSYTVFVATDGGDFKIWQRQIDPSLTQAVYNGEAGKSYEFLAVAVDNAGNREAASVANAVLPDDGSQQAVLDALGVTDALTQSPELPLAAPGRSYAANSLFQQARRALPGSVAPAQPGDLQSVLAPFSLRGLADGFAQSDGDVGALAMVELADHSFLVSAGKLRNEVFQYSKDGGHNTTPLFTLQEPVLDMAVDSVGQLWVMTGSELLQVDASSGAILRRMSGPGQDPLTHALAIEQSSGNIFVSSGNGIEIFHPTETNPAKVWSHFSNQRVADLAFGPDQRLWAVSWSGSSITAAQANGRTDIVSFPMTGRFVGRPELEYRLDGVVDSIAFGAAGSELDGLMLASSQPRQRPVIDGLSVIPHQSAVWMIELASQRVLQVATGGTLGEAIMTTFDGRILVAQSGHVDEIAPIHAPQVTAVSVPDGALLALPVGQIAVVFDQAMWLGSAGDRSDDGSVLNPENFSLTALGANAGRVITPQSVRWDASRRTAYIDISQLPAGQFELNVSNTLRSHNQQRMAQSFISTFTAVLDMTSQIKLDFTHTRSNRADGSVSYDVSLTNIGSDDLNGPLMLLLDPGAYFADSIANGTLGSGDQSDLWILDLSAGLQTAALGGKLKAGASLANQTVSVVSASRFATQAGMASLVKFNLGQGIYAVPQENLAPILTVAGAIQADGITPDLDADTLSAATVGQAWTGQVEAIDADGTQLFWSLVQAPQGVVLSTSAAYTSAADGYHALASLSWTPSARDLANSEIVLRVQDSRGGVATKRFQLPVTGGNHAPVVDAMYDLTLVEGQTLSLALTAADADGDTLTLTVRKLPAGAVFNASTGILSWTPGYDQAGTYNDIVVVASDGKATSTQRLNLTVEQGYAKPSLGLVAPQTLREGDAFGLQLAGHMPGGLPVAGPPQDGNGPLGGQRSVGAWVSPPSPGRPKTGTAPSGGSAAWGLGSPPSPGRPKTGTAPSGGSAAWGLTTFSPMAPASHWNTLRPGCPEVPRLIPKPAGSNGCPVTPSTAATPCPLP